MSVVLGYNTNGFAHHRLHDALSILSRLGYRAVGLTIDVHHAPLESTDFKELGKELRGLKLLPVVETGARFYLDPTKKHRPTLMEDRGGKRMEFLLRCVDAARDLGARCVSLWSGAGDSWSRLVKGLARVCDAADENGIDVGFEPEPGMFVSTMAQFDELRRRLPHPRLCLTLDVGHAFCLETEPVGEIVDRYAPLLRNVHLDDHRKGVHEHLFFGDGGIDFVPVLDALQRAAKGRDLPATVELSRHGHDAVATAKRALSFLRAASRGATTSS
ncbi:MAG TPA: sugar phosphate isomerase/epimerase family protein [Planctomycetota bacterium]|nr:sugar phosphate isomerase/epimerase family protein [Planctomycetota bacterium]